MKLKKLASLAMSGVLCVSMLAACGGGSSSSAAVSGSAASGSASAEGTGNVTPVGEYPIVNEPITFKIMGAKDPGAPDWSELEVFQRLSEITNINFEFEVSRPAPGPNRKTLRWWAASTATSSCAIRVRPTPIWPLPTRRPTARRGFFWT